MGLEKTVQELRHLPVRSHFQFHLLHQVEPWRPLGAAGVPPGNSQQHRPRDHHVLGPLN